MGKVVVAGGRELTYSDVNDLESGKVHIVSSFPTGGPPPDRWQITIVLTSGLGSPGDTVTLTTYAVCGNP